MADSAMLQKAMDSTAQAPAATDTSAPVDETATQDDGTVTIPKGTLPAGVKEGDIIQFEYVTETDEGCVLRAVESRIKMGGAGAQDVKAAGPDASSVGMPPPGTPPPQGV